MLAHALLLEEERAARSELDGDGHADEERREQGERADGDGDVEEPLQRELGALRRRALEVHVPVGDGARGGPRAVEPQVAGREREGDAEALADVHRRLHLVGVTADVARDEDLVDGVLREHVVEGIGGAEHRAGQPAVVANLVREGEVAEDAAVRPGAAHLEPGVTTERAGADDEDLGRDGVYPEARAPDAEAHDERARENHAEEGAGTERRGRRGEEPLQDREAGHDPEDQERSDHQIAVRALGLPRRVMPHDAAPHEPERGRGHERGGCERRRAVRRGDRGRAGQEREIEDDVELGERALGRFAQRSEHRVLLRRIEGSPGNAGNSAVSKMDTSRGPAKRRVITPRIAPSLRRARDRCAAAYDTYRSSSSS